MRKFSSSVVPPLAALLAVIGIAASVSSRQPDKTADDASPRLATNVVNERNKRCASQRTYGAIQRELFRQAADTRGSDEAAFGQISNYSIVRMEQPIVRSFDKELGTVRCSGKLILQLPRGVAVVGGRQALAAEIDYVLQPAADGSGDVVMLEGEAPITVPLATLARSGSYADLPAGRAQVESPQVAAASAPTMPEAFARPAVAAPAVEARMPQPARPVARPAPELAKLPRTSAKVATARAEVASAKVRPSTASAKPAVANARPATAGAKPSFNCRYARTRGEISVCRDAGLASLDRRMASDYYRAVASANAAQRDALRSSRNAFLRKRDRCSTQACMSASYQERMSEIGSIVESR